MSRTAPGQVTFLPEPERQHRRFPIFSVDDHIIEPSDLFDGRLPAAWAGRAPRIITDERGAEAWLFEGELDHNIGLSAVAGRPLEECAYEPERFEHMRRGAWDPVARVHDMDIAGVYASVCFPSKLIGFGGQRLQLRPSIEPSFARALVRAVNNWHLESWIGDRRDRFVGVQIPYLLDPAVAAEEIRSNADRGFTAVTFPEAPHKLGLPSLHTGYWDPFVAACAETNTVICLHIGSSSDSPSTAPDAPFDTVGVLFFAYAMFTAVDWLYSMYPVRYPDLKVAMSEGGIAWVPGLLDRLDHVARYHSIYGTWTGIDLSPAEVFQRNFWHCVLEDPANLRLRDRIGVDRTMIEVDYPHLDTNWPHSQDHFLRQLPGATPHELRRIAWENASELFRHPVPASVAADPDMF